MERGEEHPHEHTVQLDDDKGGNRISSTDSQFRAQPSSFGGWPYWEPIQFVALSKATLD